jgi:hypothetical protein
MQTTDILYQSGVPVEDALTQAQLWAYWYYALVQHYGPGTHLLDVTHSLDVALWFALHRASVSKSIQIAFVNRDARPTSPFPNLVREDEWITHAPWTDSPGVLYIFDVAAWGGNAPPQHGELVDLALGPDFFARSARIKAQQGCLIASDPACDNGDLLRFLVHPPIRVAWPMAGYEKSGFSTWSMFPSPKEDEWYTRLLFLPMVPHVERSPPNWRMVHPVPISMYTEHLEAAQYAITFNPLQPPLLWPWLIMPTLLVQPPCEAVVERAAGFIDAVPILLETPFVVLNPEQDSPIWNHADLAFNLPDVLGVLEWEGGEMSEQPVLLWNVFIELSPLECVGWTDLLQRNRRMHAPRAIHLARQDALLWELQLFFQHAPKEEVGVLFNEPAPVRFDQASLRLQIQKSDGWSDISSDPVAAKSLLVALSILRALKPDPNSPLPMREAYRTAPAVLVRTPDLIPDLPYYVVRDTSTNEPYLPPDLIHRRGSRER